MSGRGRPVTVIKKLNTRRTYDKGVELWTRWCSEQRRDPSAHRDVRAYMDVLMGGVKPKAPATILLRLQSIAGFLRQSAGVDLFDDLWFQSLRARLNSELKEQRKGNRAKGYNCHPFGVRELRQVFAGRDMTVADYRNRAWMLLVLVAELTPREIQVLRVADLSFDDRGAWLRCEKREVRVDRGATRLCPVLALREYLEVSKLRGGNLFPVCERGRSGRLRTNGSGIDHYNQRDIIMRYAELIGLNPAGYKPSSLIEGRKRDYNATRAFGL